MVDVVVFLKKDYTEKEIYKIADEVNARIRKYTVDIYDVMILKTTDKAVYHENKDSMMEVPAEYVEANLSVEGMKLSKEEDKVYRSRDNEAIRSFIKSDRGQKLHAEYIDITIKYYAENGNSVDHKIEPNKYVLTTRMNSGAFGEFKDILTKCKVAVSDIIFWEHAEFSPNAFEKIAPKTE